MPSLKVGNKDVAPEATGFGVYEGPEPRNGVYNAEIRSMRMKESKAGNLYFNMLLEFKDNEGEKEVFNGYPLWHMLTPGDSELQQTRVVQLINAVTGRREASVDYNPLDAKEDTGKVNKIGGKDPIGTKVKITVQRERDNRNAEDYQIRVTDIFPRKSGPATPTLLEVDVEEIEEITDEDAVDPDGIDLEEIREELEGLTLVKLKAYAKENTELGVADLKGLKAPEVVELILAQFSSDEDAEEQEEASEDEGDELREEVAGLSLADLKKRAKANGATLKDLKGLSQEQIVDLVISQESSEDGDEEPADGAAEKNEDGLWLYAFTFEKPREEVVAMLVEAGYDADDFEDEDDYDQESLVDTLVEEGVVAPKDETPF